MKAGIPVNKPSSPGERNVLLAGMRVVKMEKS